jgi:hypothetical protein
MPSSRLDSVESNDRGMAQKLATKNGRSPAARAMDEAIQLGIAGQSPYRDNATFVDAGEAWAGEAIKQAVDEARAGRPRNARRHDWSMPGRQRPGVSRGGHELRWRSGRGASDRLPGA